MCRICEICFDGAEAAAQQVLGQNTVNKHGGCDKPTIGAQGTEDERHLRCAVEKNASKEEKEKEGIQEKSQRQRSVKCHQVLHANNGCFKQPKSERKQHLKNATRLGK